MRYLLDTNACIRILNNSSHSLVERLRRHGPREIGICSIVRAELTYGACRSARVAENLEILALRAGTPIGSNDLLIATAARAHGLILVTHNLREFLRVSSLKVEDWEEGPG